MKILTEEQRRVLHELGDGFEKQASLAARLAISPQTLTRILRELHGADLVRRTGRGGVLYGLTDEGARANGTSPASPVRSDVDVNRVIELLEARSNQLDVAIRALKELGG